MPQFSAAEARERTWLEVLAASALLALLLVGAVWLATHEVAPRLLAHYEGFPSLVTAPKYTTGPSGARGDPVNVAVVGSRAELDSAFRAANWKIPDSLSRASDVAIAKSVLLNRPDSTAPLSNLFLLGRRQDVAFEQELGPSARRRHHVRFWRDTAHSYEGRDVWLGAATLDARAGMSHRALRPTHHIAPDIDEERDTIEAALSHASQVEATFRVTGIGVRVDSHNAEGDRYDTDGELRIVVLSRGNTPHAPPDDPGVPPIVALKDRLWAWAHGRR